MAARPRAVGARRRLWGRRQGPLGHGYGRLSVAKTMGARPRVVGARRGGMAKTVGALPGSVGAWLMPYGREEGPWGLGQNHGGAL